MKDLFLSVLGFNTGLYVVFYSASLILN